MANTASSKSTSSLLNILGRGSVLTKVLRRVIAMVMLSILVTAIHMGWLPAVHYHFQKLGFEIQAFYGIVGSLLGLLLSFRINFSMGRWQDGIVAARMLLATAKQIVTQCAFIDDSFNPVSGRGDPGKVGPHPDAFLREWACMHSVDGPATSPHGSPNRMYRRKTQFDEMVTVTSACDAAKMSDAAGAMLRIRHLALAVCELTSKHVRFDADLSDLKSKGRFDDVTYQMLTTHPLVVCADNLEQPETASPYDDDFRTTTRVNLCIMWLREEAIRAFRGGLTLHVFTNQMNMKIDNLAAAATAVVRIGRTPMPFVYAQFTKHVTWSYVLSAPFYLVTVAGAYSAVFVFVMAFFFLGLDEIAVQLEEPFGEDETDINLKGDCEWLERETACLVSVRLARDVPESHPVIYSKPVEFANHASYRASDSCFETFGCSSCCSGNDGADLSPKLSGYVGRTLSPYPLGRAQCCGLLNT